MCKKRLDMRECMPSGMEEYLGLYGWHISKKLCEWAASKMKSRSGVSLTCSKQDVESMLHRYDIDTSPFVAYDHVYVCLMAKSDFWGSSIVDERSLAMFIKDYLTDPDGYDEVAMTRLYADCIGKGEMPDWEECV